MVLWCVVEILVNKHSDDILKLSVYLMGLILVTHIAWPKGPHLGFFAHVHMGPMWTAHVGVVNFAPGAPCNAIHGPHVGNHIGPRDEISQLMGTMWAPSKFSEHTWAPHGPLINSTWATPGPQ